MRSCAAAGARASSVEQRNIIVRLRMMGDPISLPPTPLFSERIRGMLRIITLNLNGIRSALAKGFPRWLARQRPDVVCLQEVKAQEADLAGLALVPKGYHGYYDCCSTKKGYSGVALYSRSEPDKLSRGFGSREFDPEGRFLRADFGALSVVSVYLPSGSSSEERQRAKFRFLEEFLPVLEKLKASGREFVICGDWNIAHKEIDLENWRGNRKNSGFLPRNGHGSPTYSTKWAGSTCSAASIRGPGSTPGGRTAARPGRRTSAGASTTRSPRRESPPRRGRQESSRPSV